MSTNKHGERAETKGGDRGETPNVRVAHSQPDMYSTQHTLLCQWWKASHTQCIIVCVDDSQTCRGRLYYAIMHALAT